MENIPWKSIAEFTGVGAIVASLVFVGLQLKQSQEIAIAAQYHDRAALTIEYFNAQLASGDLARWGIIAGGEATPERSLENIGLWYLTGFGRLIMADNHYYQYQSGFLDEESWAAQRRSLKSNIAPLESPIRHSYMIFRNFFRDSFVALCDELLAEADSEAGQ